MSPLVIASNNPGKLREFAAWFATIGFETIAQGTLGVTEAEEPHATFVENALAKARHASAASKLPALADDSGPFTAPGVTWATHGEPFVAAVENGPLSATQFHPEKSGEAGVALLRNWLDTL